MLPARRSQVVRSSLTLAGLKKEWLLFFWPRSHTIISRHCDYKLQTHWWYDLVTKIAKWNFEIIIFYKTRWDTINKINVKHILELNLNHYTLSQSHSVLKSEKYHISHLPDRLKPSTIFSSQILVLGTFLNYIHVSPQGKLQIFWDFSPLCRVSTYTQPKSFTLMMMTVWWSSLCKNLWPTQSGHKTWTLLRLCLIWG